MTTFAADPRFATVCRCLASPTDFIGIAEGATVEEHRALLRRAFTMTRAERKPLVTPIPEEHRAEAWSLELAEADEFELWREWQAAGGGLEAGELTGDALRALILGRRCPALDLDGLLDVVRRMRNLQAFPEATTLGDIRAAIVGMHAGREGPSKARGEQG